MTVGNGMYDAVAPDAALSSPGSTLRRSGPRPYDFRRPSKLSRDHVRLIQIAAETFARQFGTVLTTTLRTVSTVSLAGVEQLTYDEYIRTMDSPSFMTVLALDPLPNPGVLNLPLRTAMLAVDHLLGGTGTGQQPQRAATEIEQQLVRSMVDRVLHELAYAFESLVPLQPRVMQVESNPRFAQVAATSDMMVVSSFELRLGAHEAVVTLCLPLDSLVPALEAAAAPAALGGRDASARTRFVGRLRQRLHDVPVEVSVQFASVPMSPAEILGLRVGDVVRLPHPVSAPLAVTASGVATAYGVPGAKGRRLACRIVAAPEEHEPA